MPFAMAVKPVLRPLGSTEEELRSLGEKMDENEKIPQRKIIGYYVRFTKFLGWMAMIGITLMTGSITWMASSLVGLKSDVAVLLSRPEFVTKSQYERDSKHWDEELEELRRLHERDLNK